jgi:hypothetical protein
VRAFVAACAVAGVTHFSQAFRLTDSKGLSYRRICSALPDQALRTIRDTFVARRKAEIEARKLVKQTQGKLHRLLASDATQSRKLTRLAESLETRRGVSGVQGHLPEGKVTYSSHWCNLQWHSERSGQAGCKGSAE